MTRTPESQQAKQEARQDRRVKGMARYITRHVSRGITEMPARVRPSMFIPSVNDETLARVAETLAQNDIIITRSELSNYADDTGDRIRVVSVPEEYRAAVESRDQRTHVEKWQDR